MIPHFHPADKPSHRGLGIRVMNEMVETLSSNEDKTHKMKVHKSVLDNLIFALECSPRGVRRNYQYNNKFNPVLHLTNFEVVDDDGKVDEFNTRRLKSFLKDYNPPTPS